MGKTFLHAENTPIKHGKKPPLALTCSMKTQILFK
jgi:hypothetical protein